MPGLLKLDLEFLPVSIACFKSKKKFPPVAKFLKYSDCIVGSHCQCRENPVHSKYVDVVLWPMLTVEASLSVKEHQPLYEAVAEELPPCENHTVPNVMCVSVSVCLYSTEMIACLHICAISTNNVAVCTDLPLHINIS